MYNLDDHQLLTLLKAGHHEVPMIDRTGFYICLSVIIVGIALYLFYWALRLRTFHATKKISKKNIACKILLIFLAFILIFFATVSKRRTCLICSRCCVSYTYDEYRVLGKIIFLDRFETWDPAQNILCKRLGNKTLCTHNYEIENRIKYWGMYIPTREYYYGNITWGLSDGSKLDRPYVITDRFMYKDEKDEETGYIYLKVYETNE